LHLSVDQLTGVISNASWISELQAERNAANAVGAGGEFVVMEGGVAVGHLGITNLSGGTAKATGVLIGGASILRTAPITLDLAAPLYVPLYSGRGAFLGWISLTKGATNYGAALWIKPGSTNATSVRLAPE